MEGQRNYFTQGETQDTSWVGKPPMVLWKQDMQKINPDKEHNQPFPSIKWIKAIEFSCQKNEVNIMSLSMKPQA